MRALALLVVLPLLCTGCFSYRVAPDAAPARGARVRASLSRPHDVRLTNVTANDVVRLEGEVVRAGADTAVFSAWALRSRSGYEFPAAGETVRLGSDAIARLEVRRFDPLRTAALVAGVLLGMAVVDHAVGGLVGGGSSQPPGGGAPR